MKERIKSCLLSLLIISSIVLSINMWFNEKLWSNDYNFFSNITNIFKSENKGKSYYLSKENISYPEKIIINNMEKRNRYTHTSKEYLQMIEPILSTIKKGFTECKFEETSKDDWNVILKSKSIYISYPIAYDTTLLSGILDVTANEVPAKLIKDIIIYPTDPQSLTVNIFIKDDDNNKIYKSTINHNYTFFSEIVEKYAIDSINLIPYSFELNFDKSSDVIEQKVVIEPTVTLKLEEQTLPNIKSQNCLTNIYEDVYTSSNILRSFGYNTTNTKKYLDKNNTSVYVENFSTLKIHNNGLLEYKSIDNTKGISLTNKNSSTLYDNFIACIEFVNNLWDNAMPGKIFNVNLTSDILFDQKGQSFSITMDYYINGHPVICKLDKTSSYDELLHGIEIKVSDGKIVEYRQLFNEYSLTSQIIKKGSAIDAIDAMFSNENLMSETISALNIAYVNNNNIWNPVWTATTTDNKLIIIGR